MRKKLNDNSGSVLVLVVIVIMLVSIMVGTISSQIINQIKFNKNSGDNIQAKYASESGIENTIAYLVNQMETQLNNPSNRYKPDESYSNVKRKYKHDSYAKAKEPLIQGYAKLMEVNKNYESINNLLNELYITLVKDYNSSDKIIEDILKLKIDIIHLIALDDNIVKSKVREAIYLVLDDINSSLIRVYESTHRNHDPVEIKLTGNQYYSQIDMTSINSNFLSTSSSAPKYSVSYIVNNFAEPLKKELGSFKISPHNKYINDTIIQNKLIDGVARNLRDKLIHTVEDKLKGFSGTGGSNIDVVKHEINNKKMEVINNITKFIDSTQISNSNSEVNSISDIEGRLYKLYIDDYGKYIDLNDNTKLKLFKSINLIEGLKVDLIETRCKLGFNNIDVGGDIIIPEPPAGSIEPKDLYIEVDKYNKQLSDNCKYEVEEIQKTEIPVTYTSNIISSVDDMNLDIISKGINQSQNHKIKANVTLQTNFKEGKFIVSYYINSYNKIS